MVPFVLAVNKGLCTTFRTVLIKMRFVYKKSVNAHPHKPYEIYCTLTNNSERGKDGKPGVDAANPRVDNSFGQIIRWFEGDNNPATTEFVWDLFALGGSPTGKGDKKASVQGDTFGSPDGLKFASNGLLWVQTDVSTSTLNEKDYAGMGNNQMLAVIPERGEFRRFLTGPRGCEITGIAFTPDNRTMFNGAPLTFRQLWVNGQKAVRPPGARALRRPQRPERYGRR
jgi:secreted PhoX family phosphatase